MIWMPLAGSTPSVQGKAVVHAPVVETQVNPGGVGSRTTTFAASDGPVLVTVIV